MQQGADIYFKQAHLPYGKELGRQVECSQGLPATAAVTASPHLWYLWVKFRLHSPLCALHLIQIAHKSRGVYDAGRRYGGKMPRGLENHVSGEVRQQRIRFGSLKAEGLMLHRLWCLEISACRLLIQRFACIVAIESSLCG